MQLGQVWSCSNEFRKGYPGSLINPTVSVKPKSLQSLDCGWSLDEAEEFYDPVIVKPVLVQDQEPQIRLLSEELEKQPSAVVVHEPLI